MQGVSKERELAKLRAGVELEQRQLLAQLLRENAEAVAHTEKARSEKHRRVAELRRQRENRKQRERDRYRQETRDRRTTQ